MKTRYFFSFAFVSLLVYVLGAGCTQDFGAFQPCSFGEKVCGSRCASIGDPEVGCGAEACDPCGLPHATSTCDKSECAIGTCDGTFQNCDDSAENGCESDVMTDATQCGACGNLCVVPNAQAACKQGECAVGTCNDPWDDCDGEVTNGCEANLDNEPEHCGNCDTACPQFESCQAGQCVLVCEPGKGDCDNDPDNGCETDFGTTANCTFCGDACDLANADAACTAGACVIDDCDNGFDDCDGMAANGCEANLETSAMTCGACDNACPNGANGTAVCDDGSCAINCNAGFGNCDGMLQNGCEADTSASQQNCGGCNQPCAIANGTGTCAGGTCSVTTCNAPFADCNMNPADGCEVNTSSTPAHCGMCGNACNLPGAVEGCAAGACTVVSCNGGLGNCDNMAANGCETNLATSTGNCGACGRACNNSNTAALSCAAGTCNSTCDAGFGNCSQPAAPGADNGCETNTGSSVDHCGACGRACVGGANVASKSCSGGLCDSTCVTGRGNCSQPAAPGADNGCETDVNADDTRCGSCDNNCENQGAGLDCAIGNGAQKACGCDGANGPAECNAGAAGTCTGAGLCQCSGTTCAQGEACADVGGTSTCSCNAGSACAAGQTCCESPDGCFSLQTDASNCGACGHECPTGFGCTGGGCRCDGNADCNAGTGQAFSCNLGNGRCICNGNNCAAGQRCQPNGQCG